MIPPLAQVLLFARGFVTLSFRRGGLACGGALSDTLGSLLCKGRFRFFQLNTAPVVRRVFAPQPQHRGCSRGVEHPPERCEPPHATHRGAYPQLPCVCPKRWQRLHCIGPFRATYVSTDTRSPQISVIERTLDTLGPRASDTMKWG